MAIKKILFPTQFRELAFDSLKALMELKKVGLEEVVLLHVIDRERVSYGPYTAYLKDEEEKLRKVAEIRFEEWQEYLRAQGVASKVYVMVGHPVPIILKVAQDEKVDLIIAGRKKRRALERYVGSSMLDLLQHTKCPVLVFKYMWCEEAEEGREYCVLNQRLGEHVLVAVDWSEPSQKALKFAEDSLKGILKKVTLVHILSEELDEGALEKESIEAKGKLNKMVEELKSKGIEASYVIEIGKPVQEILKIVEQQRVNMVLMGTTGKGRWRALWLGSVSQRVAELAPVPVLLVP